VSDLLRQLAETGIILAAAGTPFLIMAAWKLHDSVTQLQEMRSPKAVLDQITAFEELAKRRQETIAEQVSTAESKLREVRRICETHDYLSAVTDVRHVNSTGSRLWITKDYPQSAPLVAAIIKSGLACNSADDQHFLGDYEKLLWEQIDRLTTPGNTSS
jgi:hypothetical protein